MDELCRLRRSEEYGVCDDAGSEGIYSPRPAAALPPVSAFLPFSLAVGHSRFPALADGAFHMLGLLEDSNQRNKLFFRERVVINAKCCKV